MYRDQLRPFFLRRRGSEESIKNPSLNELQSILRIIDALSDMNFLDKRAEL